MAIAAFPMLMATESPATMMRGEVPVVSTGVCVFMRRLADGAETTAFASGVWVVPAVVKMIAATQAPAMTGVANTSRRAGNAPRRIGRSTRKYDAMAMARLRETRTAKSATPLRPVRVSFTVTNTGQCHK